MNRIALFLPFRDFLVTFVTLCLLQILHSCQNEASKKTYENLEHFVPFTKESPRVINENIKDQHPDMRQQLQVRHLLLETNLGKESVEAQNALGE